MGDTEEDIEFKKTFIDLLNDNLLLTLSNEHNDHFEKFEIKNGFINIFLKDNLKQLINKQIKSKEFTKSEDIYTVIVL